MDIKTIHNEQMIVGEECVTNHKNVGSIHFTVSIELSTAVHVFSIKSIKKHIKLCNEGMSSNKPYVCHLKLSAFLMGQVLHGRATYIAFSLA